MPHLPSSNADTRWRLEGIGSANLECTSGVATYLPIHQPTTLSRPSPTIYPLSFFVNRTPSRHRPRIPSNQFLSPASRKFHGVSRGTRLDGLDQQAGIAMLSEVMDGDDLPSNYLLTTVRNRPASNDPENTWGREEERDHFRLPVVQDAAHVSLHPLQPLCVLFPVFTGRDLSSRRSEHNRGASSIAWHASNESFHPSSISRCDRILHPRYLHTICMDDQKACRTNVEAIGRE